MTPDGRGLVGAPGAGPSGTRARQARRWRWAFAFSVVAQVVALYAPRAPSTGGVPQLDKLVHAAIFGAVAFTALRSGLRAGPVVAALLAHAVVSELVQRFVLAHRDGDWRDSVADAVGTAVGVLLARRAARAPADVHGAAPPSGAHVSVPPGTGTMGP